MAPRPLNHHGKPRLNGTIKSSWSGHGARSGCIYPSASTTSSYSRHSFLWRNLHIPPRRPSRPKTKPRPSSPRALGSGARMQELHHLKDLHATVEARALDTDAKATMLRTAIWENHTQGGLQLARMTKEMEKAIHYTPHVGRAVKHIRGTDPTFAPHHTPQPQKNMGTLGLTEHNIRNTITNNTPLPLGEKNTINGNKPHNDTYTAPLEAFPHSTCTRKSGHTLLFRT